MALLLAGWDENGPQLFHTDPSGTFVQAGGAPAAAAGLPSRLSAGPPVPAPASRPLPARRVSRL